MHEHDYLNSSLICLLHWLFWNINKEKKNNNIINCCHENAVNDFKLNFSWKHNWWLVYYVTIKISDNAKEMM